MPRKRKKIVVKVSTQRLKNGTKLRIYYWDDEKPPAKRVGKGSHGRTQ